MVATGIRTGGLFDIFGPTAAGWFGARLTLKYDALNISVMTTRTPTRKELSHNRIVDAAARAVRRAGYRGVGVADIMKEAGLTHGGFYAHFESRDALLIEAMQRAGQDNLVSLSDGIERRLRQGGTRFLW